MNAFSTHLRPILAAQKRAHLSDPFPSAKTRVDRLDRLIALVVENVAKVFRPPYTDKFRKFIKGQVS